MNETTGRLPDAPSSTNADDWWPVVQATRRRGVLCEEICRLHGYMDECASIIAKEFAL